RKLLCKGGRSSSPEFRHGCGGKREESADGLSCDSRGIKFIKTLWQRYAACSPHPASLEQVGRDSMPGEQANEEDEPDAAQVYSLKEHMFRILQELRNNADITSIRGVVCYWSQLGTDCCLLLLYIRSLQTVCLQFLQGCNGLGHELFKGSAGSLDRRAGRLEWYTKLFPVIRIEIWRDWYF
ncbi:hypothetical protein E2320_003112, partial [Naja naja]